MLSDIGINFKVNGLETAISQLNQLSSTFGNLRSSVNQGSQINANLGGMTKQFDSLHKTIKTSLDKTELLIGAFLAGKAVKGLKDWVLGGSGADIDRLKDNLKIHHATAESLGNISKTYDDIAKQRPLDKANFFRASEQIQSMVGHDNPGAFKKSAEAASNLGYIFGPEGNMDNAIDVMRPFLEGYGSNLGTDAKARLFEQGVAYAKHLTDSVLIRGKDIQQILPQIAGAYSSAKRDPAQMFAHMGILGGSLGGQAGEVLKGLFGKEGTAYGKLMAESQKQQMLARLMTDQKFKADMDKFAARTYDERLPRIIKSEADLPDRFRHALSGWAEDGAKHYAAQGGRLLANRKDEVYFRDIKNAMALLEKTQGVTGRSPNAVIAEMYGETSVKGFNTLVDAIASGREKQMIQALKGVDPGGVTGHIDKSFSSLGSKGEIFDQSISGLQSDFKRMFEEPIKSLLGEWQSSVDMVREKFQAFNKQAELKEGINRLMEGVSSGYSSALGADPGVKKSLEQRVDEFITGLGSPNAWQQAGDKIGQASGEFLLVIKKMGELVGKIDTVISPIASSINGVSSFFGAIVGKLFGGRKGAIAGGLVGAGDWWSVAGGALGGAWSVSPYITNPYAIGAGAVAGGLAAAYQQGMLSLQQVSPPSTGFQPLTAHAPGLMIPIGPQTPDYTRPVHSEQSKSDFVPMGEFTGKLESTININVDGESLAAGVEKRVTEKVIGHIRSEKDRGRMNSLDWNWP